MWHDRRLPENDIAAMNPSRAHGIHHPRFLGRHWLAPGAQLIGDVELGEDVGVWFNAVIRADNAPIRIGARSNVQDGAVLHVDPGVPLSIGSGVSVGHLAMLHGCTVGDGSLIGIGAVVLNGAVIGRNCLIGAKALVTENTVVPDGSLFLGAPGKVVRSVSEAQIAGIRAGADSYVAKIEAYREAYRAP